MRIIEDPVSDPQWAAMLERHPGASIFHTPGWLKALRQTYGYRPFVVTASAGALEGGLVLCEVTPWLSRRLVSLPFSDHCEPLANGDGGLRDIASFLVRYARDIGAGSVELRPATMGLQALDADPRELQPSASYWLHRLDLRPDAAEIFGRFHHSSTQRAIRRAEREQLTYESGTSSGMLQAFYRLMRMTRRRHGLPPQPFAWFRNLVACLGDRLTIHIASKHGQPVASVVTLSFKKEIVYKYGASDEAFHSLGGMPFLFWRVIQNAKQHGFEVLDLGRSDLDQSGLIAFKEHLGAARLPLTYYRYPGRVSARSAPRWTSAVARRIVARLPDSALDAAGRLLYKHLG